MPETQTMTQAEARAEAKRLNREQPIDGLVWVATTVCAMRGEFEQGADADQWTVTGMVA
jgi:hypothetical protein